MSRTCQAGRRRRPRELGGADQAVPIAAAPDGQLPARPAAPGAGRPRPTSSRRSTSRPGSTCGTYVSQPDMPFFLWLRDRGPQAAGAAPAPPRHADAGRAAGGLALPGVAARGHLRGPGRAAPGAPDPARARRPCGPRAKIQLQEALNAMDPIDREVLALRHFEQLTGPRRPRCSASRRRPPACATSAPCGGSRRSSTSLGGWAEP